MRRRVHAAWLLALAAPGAAQAARDDLPPVQAVAVGDFDGDGIPDVAAALPEVKVGKVKGAGVVRVYSGKTGSLLWKVEGTEEDEGYGEAIAAVGDIDKDGATDLAVSSPYAEAGGRVDFFSGKTGKKHHVFPGGNVIGFGDELCALGDGSGAQSVGIVIRAGVGGTWWVASSERVQHTSQLEDPAGMSTATQWVGDLDGDGFQDFAIAAWSEDVGGKKGAGRIRVLSGIALQGTVASKEDRGTERDVSLRLEMFQLRGTRAQEGLGLNFAPAGDFDGDGKGDLLLGDRGDEKARTSWSVRVLSGKDRAELWRATGPPRDTILGGIATLGDVNGDGKPDYAVGSPRAPLGACSVSLLSGADGSVLWTVAGAKREFLGENLYPAADADGDGVRDLVVESSGAALSGKRGNGYLRILSGKSGALLRVLNPLQ